MPELPEVETTVRDLSRFKNDYIQYVSIHTNKLRYKIPKKNILNIKNCKIKSIYRKAKYIIIELNNQFSIIIHLGMSGRLKSINIKNSKKNELHDHIKIYLRKNIITFNDPRKFGIFDFIPSKDINKSKYFKNLGPDPFSINLNFEYLYKKMKSSKTSIKTFLLNQKNVVGIGNIYASEILFDCKISPFRTTNSINNKKIRVLIKSIRKILKKAIMYRGSTLRDFKSINGKLGNFQRKFKVYAKEGQYIEVNLKRNLIIKKKQQGRSTYYCPNIQI